MTRWLTLLCGLSLLTSCDVATVDSAPSAIAKNVCTSSGDCSGGDCDEGQCRSHTGLLDSVLFEVTPPADATIIQGVQFLLPPTGALSPAGGDLSLDLGTVVQVSGSVTVLDRACTPQFDLATSKDGSIPALLTLTPSTTALGLYSQRTVAESVLIDSKNFSFSAYIAPGSYDIYVEPKHQPDADCVVPPELLRAQKLNGGALNLQIALREPATFEFHVTWLKAAGALNGWSVDMLDPRSGLVISNRVPLSLGAAGGDNSKADYVAKMYYSPVVGDTTSQSAAELVRLSPPSNRIAPTILLARSALGLFTPNRGVLDKFVALPLPVTVKGQVTDEGTPTPAAASVTLVATEITGIDPGVLASFVRKVDVGADGQFEIDLLPGTYRVTAVPSASLDQATGRGLAAVSYDWVVAGEPSVQAGRVIALGHTLPINGQAFSGSTPLATADVLAVASPASVRSDVLQQALGGTELVPRASTGSVLETGDFGLNSDLGLFDITVRPLSSTGFGWLVIPSVTVAQSSAGPNLRRQEAPPPVAYRGTVVAPAATPDGRNVPGALIRAYVYMSGGQYVADPEKADSVLQVAETRSDANGDFEVLIPASLNHWDAPTP
ncbi:MAG: carboxypeptidase-like regulatory domain-containing protein [Polyangiaceae bacterium]